MTDAEILAGAEALQPWLVETRRHIHRRPELGREEFETAAYIESRLDELGLEHRRVGTGIIARLDGGLRAGGGQAGGRSVPTVAIRADIDALPVQERGSLDFRSEKAGLMHACGHDAHTAIALGVAKFFAQRRAELEARLVFLFQQDEEGDGGAVTLIEAGALEGVDAILGLHVMPYLDAGKVEVKKGAMNGSSTTLSVAVRGVGSHGAYPEGGIDAVLISAHVVQALNQLVSRYISPLDEAVLTVGTIHGGQRSNIVADEVRMEATLRTTSDAVRDRLVDRARSLVEGIPASFGGSGSLKVSYGYTSLVNHDHEVDIVAGAASGLLGPAAVSWKDKPSMGVEDFAFYLKKLPGAFWHLGCGSGPDGKRAPLHSGDFLLDEACLRIGVAVQAASVLAIIAERRGS
jgi:amidohydrolase